MRNDISLDIFVCQKKKKKTHDLDQSSLKIASFGNLMERYVQ